MPFSGLIETLERGFWAPHGFGGACSSSEDSFWRVFVNDRCEKLELDKTLDSCKDMGKVKSLFSRQNIAWTTSERVNHGYKTYLLSLVWLHEKT